MTEVHWIILGYFAIGLAFIEGIIWAKVKMRFVQLDRLAVLLIFFFWPFIILLVFIDVWRENK